VSEKSVLCVFAEDTAMLQTIGGLAETAGYRIEGTTLPGELLERLTALQPHVVVVDLQLPGMDGIELMRELSDREVDAGIILLSDTGERDLASAEGYGLAHGLNVIAAIRKPIDTEDLISRLVALHSASARLSSRDIENAIRRDEFIVHYQPTLSRADDGRWIITAMEALLRWQHPIKGTIDPHKFVSMAEECGLDGALTDFVIRSGLEELKRWQEAQLDIGLRINVSAGLFADSDFPDRLEAELIRYGVDPSRLTLELAETAMLRQDVEAFDIMTRLRVKNVNIAIDDFGIGYSSLTQLFEMPFNEMKIDNSLVARIPESKQASIMVTALVDLAHKLDLTVCAEGVETEQALNFLASIGCDAAQGFFVSYPIPAGDVRVAIDAWDDRIAAAAPGELAALA
jgi:EAL domain-containing protein (putative c-di-GMP-specific phosphodiesterase class I)/CheY-like chemotaxis protein